MAIKNTNVKNIVVDKSSGRQLRIMEDTLVSILTPYVQKLSKNRNWYSPLLLLAGSGLALAKINYDDFIVHSEEGVYLVVNSEPFMYAVVYAVIAIIAIVLFAFPICTLWQQRKDDLSVHGIMKEIMSEPSTEQDLKADEKR